MQITWGEETYDVRRGKRDKIEVWQGDTHLFSLAHDFPVDLISEVCRIYGMGRSRGEYQRDRLHPSQTPTQPPPGG